MRYDPGENRRKHHWSKPEAGFNRVGTAMVGKCSSKITMEIAQELLSSSLPYLNNEGPAQRVYNVFDGVIYEAVSSGDEAWHGYPWRSRPGRSSLPKDLMKELERRAAEQKCLREYKEWVKTYGN
ncbi:MAG: hypothetical protein WCQ50_20405 [Spirochaetota bacterium]